MEENIRLENEEAVYTPEDLAEKLKVSLKTIRKFTGKKRVPGQVMVGKQWRFRKPEVDKRLALKNQFFLDFKPRPITQIGKIRFSEPAPRTQSQNGGAK